MNQIYSCLWFNTNAKESAEYYCSIFEDGKIIQENPMVVMFEINKTKFMGLNGGPKFDFSPATSFVIECETQEQIDHYWEKLGYEGSYQMCGWLTDKFGVSWQVVPSILPKLMEDPEKATKVMEAFLKMKKFDIETLIKA